MFRALAALGKSEGFTSQSEFVSNQSDLFTKQLANTYLTGLPTSSTNTPKNALKNSKFALGTWDPNTRQASLRDIDIAEYATSLDINKELVDANQRCLVTPIDELINTENLNARVRCGWIYQRGNPTDQPKVSQGALGTRNTPAGFFTNPTGKWYWNLDDAKRDIMADRCSALTDCKNVGATNYSGCAWSTTRGTGIPVDRNGFALYPRDERLSAPQSSLITNPTQCPPPPPPNSPQAELARSRDVCAPMANGRLSRDCILQQVTAAGCKTDGTLYTQLITAATPGNYASGLSSQLSYKKYQQLAKNPLLDTVVRDGTASAQTALSNFKGLAALSSEVKETALNYAARDLCLTVGVMDTFDFCTELADGSLAPFALECLQKEFSKKGGQPAGNAYPTQFNKSSWDSLGTWKKVKDKIATLVAGTTSPVENTQREALKQFLGITREPYGPPQISRIPGVEIIYFNRGNNTFIGRRIQSDFAKFSTGGDVEGTGLYDFVEFYSITNMRPTTNQKIKLRLETDDGILFTLNKQVDGSATRGGFFDSTDSFGANWDQAPTQYTANKCWDLKGNGPNYVMGFWQETGGIAHSQIFYAPCTGGQFGAIPVDWMTLTQEEDAPMFSWQGMKDANGNVGFSERRMPTVMGLDTSAKTTLVETVVIQGIPAALKLRNNGSGFAISKRNIGGLSWRTLSLCFSVTTRPNDSQILLNLGRLTVSINGSQLNLTHSTIAGGSYQMPLTVFDGKTPYYFVCNMRSDFTKMYPNRITFAFGSVSDWKSGRVVFGQSGPNGASWATTDNSPIVSPTSGDKLNLGDPNGVNTADANIYFARLFDYEMDTKDILRDINNTWQMAFF
jgi:hypothetical protein